MSAKGPGQPKEPHRARQARGRAGNEQATNRRNGGGADLGDTKGAAVRPFHLGRGAPAATTSRLRGGRWAGGTFGGRRHRAREDAGGHVGCRAGPMSKRFTGTYRHKVEARGRVSLPAPFRKVFAEMAASELVVVPCAERDDAHLCFTLPGFEAFCARIEAAITDPVEQRATLRALNATASILDLDDLGRVVLPKALRDEIGIEGDCDFVGTGFAFEIAHPVEAAAAGDGEAALTRAVFGRVSLSDLH